MVPKRSSFITWLSNPKLWLVVLLVFAGALRLYDLTDEPMELHPTRQFRALIIARGFYYPTAEDIPADHVEFALRQAAQVGLIEPSILEFFTAQLYKLAGKELTWLGRIIPITFWLLGGLAVYALARNFGSKLAGVISLTYFLFLPFSTGLSRVLMVDPIMTAGTAASLWALYIWVQRQKAGWAAAAGILTGITILLKSVAGIILIVPFALFLLASFSLKDLLKNRQVWLILVLALLPTAGWYYYGLFIDGRMATQFKGRFFPEIWTDPVFYKSWGLQILREFNMLAFAAGLFGILLAKTKPVRRLLFGWWAGYFIYAVLFAYYTWTHDYYHLPMVPLVAVSLAPAAAALEEYAEGKGRHRLAILAAAAVCVFIAGYGSVKTIRFLSAVDFRQTRRGLEQLGEELDELPPGTVVGLTDDYETSFSFYTFRYAVHWPTTGDQNFRQLQGAEDAGFDQLWHLTDDASYFFVTDQKQLDKQPLLTTHLEELPVISQTEVYTLFDLSPKLEP